MPHHPPASKSMTYDRISMTYISMPHDLKIHDL